MAPLFLYRWDEGEYRGLSVPALRASDRKDVRLVIVHPKKFESQGFRAEGPFHTGLGESPRI